MSDSDRSDTLSTISTVSSLTNSEYLDSPPPYSPPRIHAEPELKPSDPPTDDETLTSTLTTASTSTRRESSICSPSPVASRSLVPLSPSPPQQQRKKVRQESTGHNHADDYSNRHNNDSPRNRSSAPARPPRVQRQDSHPPQAPAMIASSSPPLPLTSSFPPNPPPPPPPPRAPDPPRNNNMYMGANPWMHPAQGFSIHQSASPSGASQSINFFGPAIPPPPVPPPPPPPFMPQNYYPPNVPSNMGMGMGMGMNMGGMEDMRRGMEDMRRNMQQGMEDMRNSMRQAHFEMNSAFHGGNRPHRHSRAPRTSYNSAERMVVIGNQAYDADDLDDGALVINSGRRRGSGGNRISVNGQNYGVWGGGRGGRHGSYAVSVSSVGGGQAVSQTYVGNDGNRYTYNAYQGL